MRAMSTPARYGAVAQGLHWLTVALVLAAYSTGLGGNEQHVYAATNDAARQLHESIGVLVMAITVVRLLWRSVNPAPEVSSLSPAMRFLSRAVQAALYALLVAIPVTGLLGAWWGGHPVTLYVLGDAQLTSSFSHDVGAAIATLHTWLGQAILWLAGLHAAAAIFHHVVLRDRVLLTMIPGPSGRFER